MGEIEIMDETSSFPHFVIYKCVDAGPTFKGCGYEYSAFAETQDERCPKCGNVYLKWMNYSEFEKSWIKNGKGTL